MSESRTPLVALGALVVVAWVAARAGLVHPGELPSGDVGRYLIQAERFADLYRAHDLSGVLTFAAEPQMHPPGHALLMGVWIALLGGGMASSQAYGAFMTAVGVFSVAGLARTLVPTAGPWLRVGAAALVAIASLTMQLTHTAMSEPSSLCIGLLGLWALARALQSPSLGWQILAGVVVMIGAVTRYNYVPMLLAPAVVVHVHQTWRHPLRLLDLRKAFWVIPTVALFWLWYRHDSDIYLQVRGFVINVANEDEVLSWAYLGFVPSALWEHGWHHSLWTLALGVLFLGGIGVALWGRDVERQLGQLTLRATTTPGLRLVQAFVLSTTVALTAHPYKLLRNVLILVPALTLAALLPWAGTRLRRGPTWALPALGALLLAPTTVFQLRTAVHKVDHILDQMYYQDAYIERALEEIAVHATNREWLLLSGWVQPLEPHQFELWFRERHLPTKVVIDWVEGTANGRRYKDMALPLPLARVEDLMVPDLADRLTVVLFTFTEEDDRNWPDPRFVSANAAAMEPVISGLGMVPVGEVLLPVHRAKGTIYQRP